MVIRNGIVGKLKERWSDGIYNEEYAERCIYPKIYTSKMIIYLE